MSYIKVCADEDLKEGELKAFHTKQGSVVIVRQNDAIFAFQEHCTHDDVSLAEGNLPETGIVECPAHGARFRMTDGEAIRMPATESLETFEVRIVEGNIEVNLD